MLALLSLCLLTDCVLGLRLLLEELLHPLGLAQVQESVDLELNALAVGMLAVVAHPGQVFQACREGVHQRLALLRLIKSEADGLEKLAHALDHMLFGQRVFSLLDANQVVDDLADDLHSQQLSEEKVADELHVGKHLALALLHLEVKIFGRLELLAVLVCRLECGRKALELILHCVEQHASEAVWLLALVLRWELWVASSECEDHVCIGLAVVRLHKGFAEDDLNHKLQLLSLLQVNLCQSLHDRLQVVGADLVQESAHPSLKLLQACLRLGDLVCVLALLEHRLAGARRPTDVVSRRHGWAGRASADIWRRSFAGPLARTEARDGGMLLGAVQPPNAEHQLAVKNLVGWHQVHLLLGGVGDGDRSRLLHHLNHRRRRCRCWLLLFVLVGLRLRGRGLGQRSVLQLESFCLACGAGGGQRALGCRRRSRRRGWQWLWLLLRLHGSRSRRRLLWLRLLRLLRLRRRLRRGCWELEGLHRGPQRATVGLRRLIVGTHWLQVQGLDG
mmetsp:Transcript_70036/g.163889  ORF Transcript_70036/g.163889 Transcript_70036/m.163889 type:complete len:504 (-) Transcript_70036:965-2476(-)